MNVNVSFPFFYLCGFPFFYLDLIFVLLLIKIMSHLKILVRYKSAWIVSVIKTKIIAVSMQYCSIIYCHNNCSVNSFSCFFEPVDESIHDIDYFKFNAFCMLICPIRYDPCIMCTLKTSFVFSDCRLYLVNELNPQDIMYVYLCYYTAM